MEKNYLEVAERLCPTDITEYGRWFRRCNYQAIIDYIGTVVIQEDTDDYQGDTYILYKGEPGGYGYLTFGWGSCSGCDALQACDSAQEVADLIKELEQSVKWMSGSKMLKYMEEHDWEGDHSWNSQEMRKFVSACIKYLKEDTCK